MSVGKAAKILDIGRQALSTLLNGNAALSADMAARIERAFGAPAQKLLDMQAAFDAYEAKARGAAAGARTYVPTFLAVKARDITAWSETIPARQRLAVFLRTLAHSTGIGLTKVDFPGNDDAERPGWDGYVEAGQATPWIPAGRSGWEFGVNRDPKEKADGDYAKSLKQHSPEERAEITFVFVTPRPWPGKAAWIKERRGEKQWKDVVAFDASDLEQWLEQSIPGQAWLANETDAPSNGVLSLDGAWARWAGDCEPPLALSLFDEAARAAHAAVKAKLEQGSGTPLVITADSTGEALAFLNRLFASDDEDFSMFRDRLAVFTEPGALSRLASKVANFIPVVASPEVEKELAPFRKELRSIIVYPRNLTSADAHIVLEPLSHDAFEKALGDMTLGRDRIRQLARESARSPTVLRRRLSTVHAVRTPAWAVDADLAALVIPMMLAGSWKANNESDRVHLSKLSGDIDYEEIEARLARLSQLEDAPVWSIGSFRGVVSKIDALFAIAPYITLAHLNRFFNVAKGVLAEDDPALDLPEDERWLAGMKGKTRQISGALREGLGETLVLLSVHGDFQLRPRLGVDVEGRVRRFVRDMLTPLTPRGLAAQGDDLTTYAEAAPDEFIDILEADLASDDPVVMSLLKPASTGLFGGGCPRSGLLWALEGLAWSPEQLPRVALILARLSEASIDDNWANKPEGSLSAIFRSWMPQTAATLEQRMNTLDLLAKRFPKIAWRICVEQFDGKSTIGHYSHKPRWRPDGHGKGEPVTRGEMNKFALHALELALNWREHDCAQLGDLVCAVNELPNRHQAQIWLLVETWTETASQGDRAWLREQVRVGAFSRRRRKSVSAATAAAARRAYDALAPTDVILKHEWLFRKRWVEEGVGELEDLDTDKIDFNKREERIAAQRLAALEEVFATRGIEGVIDLSEHGDAAHLIGWFLPRLIADADAFAEALAAIMARNSFADTPRLRALAAGALGALEGEREAHVLRAVAERLPDAAIANALTLFPFRQITWDLLETKIDDVRQFYWENVNPNWAKQTPAEFGYAVAHLVAAGRPRAAFQLIHMDIAEALQPRQLFELMRAVARSRETARAYQLERYYITQAFSVLRESGELSEDELASLEFLYLEALEPDVDVEEEGAKSKIPNLERHIEKNPDVFVQAVAFAFKRSDGGEDPPELRPANDEELEHRARSAYTLLQALRRIPGRDRLGKLDAKEIEAWVRKVRASLKELARVDIGDQCIGQLFAKAPKGDDGIWPLLPLRDALENVANEEMARGITTGLYNLRGVVTRGEGGDQEREIAAKYERWERAMEYTHPRVARMMRQMADNYRREADWHDTEADVRKRLRY
jgi:addiction module HigA family antidote